jgi:hypothetical protein
MSGHPMSRRENLQNYLLRTTRLDVAAFLLVRGFSLSQVELENATATATFIFLDPKKNGDAVIKDFYNSAQVSASEYADAQKRVRDLMWEAKRGSTGRKGQENICSGSNTFQMRETIRKY